MITDNQSVDMGDLKALACDLIKIRRECPRFVEYLERSVEETTRAVSEEVRYEWLLRHSAALCDLRKILSDIRDPSVIAELATPSAAGPGDGV